MRIDKRCLSGKLVEGFYLMLSTFDTFEAASNLSPLQVQKKNGEGGPDYAGASSGKILFLRVAFPDDVFKYFSRRRAVFSDLTAT